MRFLIWLIMPVAWLAADMAAAQSLGLGARSSETNTDQSGITQEQQELRRGFGMGAEPYGRTAPAGQPSKPRMEEELAALPPLSALAQYVETTLGYRSIIRAAYRNKEWQVLVYKPDGTSESLRLDPVTFEVRGATTLR